MSRVEERIAVAGPADIVWAIMRDVERWHDWTPTIKGITAVDGGALAVGAKYRVRQPKLPPVVWTVTEVVPGRSFAWTSHGAGVASYGDHRVERDGDGSTVTLVFEQTGPLAGVASLFYSRLIRRYVRTEAQELKRAAEARVQVRR